MTTIKTWPERTEMIEGVLTSHHIKDAMAEEIDELRKENAKLRDALKGVMDAVRFSNGVPTTVMQAEHMLDRISAAGVKARAALGEK